MKYQIVLSSKFKTDFKKLDSDSKELTKKIIQRLSNGETLEEKYCDHQLKGKFKEYRDCHVKPDLVLIYKLSEKTVTLTAMRISTHSNLFNK